MRNFLIALAVLCRYSITAYADISVPFIHSTVLDEREWADAQEVGMFVVTQPFTLAKSVEDNRAWYVTTPKGLAIAIRGEYLPATERTRGARPRDANPMATDLSYAIIDFDGDGQVAYEFTVSASNARRDGVFTHENQINTDWDGDWQSGVREDDHYIYTEIFIPWDTVQMKGSNEPTRQIGINIGRYIQSTATRYAYPGIAWTQPKYLSSFAKITVKQFPVSSFHVIPYVAAISDRIADRNSTKVGADIVWKPGGDHQISAALNPDFAQIEDDNLVLNFTAVETYFGDKRPFFTQNESIFDVQLSDSMRLLNTRRIGNHSDNSESGISEIRYALKATGSFDDFKYGVMTADEQSDIGRNFDALRANYTVDSFRVGTLLTHVEHPLLDRSSFVSTIDSTAYLTDNMSVDVDISSALINTRGEKTEGSAEALRLRHNVNDTFNYQIDLLAVDTKYDISDFGYLERNNLHESAVIMNQTEDWWASSLDAATMEYIYRWRTSAQGVNIPDFFSILLTLNSKAASTWTVGAWGYTPGDDDTFTRGGNIVRFNTQPHLTGSYLTRQTGQFRAQYDFQVFKEGLMGSAWEATFQPSYFPIDSIGIKAVFDYLRSDNWLVWLADNDVGQFQREQAYFSLGINFIPNERHEFLLRTQWIGLNAYDGRGLVANKSGGLQPTNSSISAMAIGDVGLQFRYRYLIGPMSDIYIAYSKGGTFYDESGVEHPISDLFSRASRLRDIEQIAVKVGYRF